jgi:enamine deaminase RidA (YjgF/YER057c/UK114 family)
LAWPGRSAGTATRSRSRRTRVCCSRPGLALDGTLPTDIAGQAELAWTHIVAMLDKAGMTVHDLVKVTHYLLNAADIPACVAVRSRFLGEVDGGRSKCGASANLGACVAPSETELLPLPPALCPEHPLTGLWRT